jgi:hypothetical protein
MKTTIAWWSGGLTSAVACRLALEKYERVRIVYIHIDAHHPDTLRFKADCEAWYGQEIETWQSPHANQFEVIAKARYVNGPAGAPCTKKLKKNVRAQVEAAIPFDRQVWGFEFALREINRAIRFEEQHPATKPVFPLIDARLTKAECAGIIASAGVEIPEMYRLGYSNNNCVGCVKGGAGYWNKIRVDFPHTFAQMAALEREVGASCLKTDTGRKYLDELRPDEGSPSDIVLPECGLFCDIEFAHILSPRAAKIFETP